MSFAGNIVRWVGWTLMAVFAVVIAWMSLDYLHVAAGDLRLPPNPPDEEWALRLHAFGGLVALAAGPWQFLPVVRRRASIVHRAAGYIYLAGVTLGVTGAAILAQTPQGGDANRFAFGMLALIWAASTAQAFRKALAKDFTVHRRWMIRSYALTFAAVTLRLGMMILPMAGFSGEASYAIVAWASWTINLIFVEWVLLPALERRAKAAV